VIAAFPGDPQTAPPSYRYFIGMVERLRNVRPQDLTENSVLLGSPAQIAETLKKLGRAAPIAWPAHREIHLARRTWSRIKQPRLLRVLRGSVPSLTTGMTHDRADFCLTPGVRRVWHPVSPTPSA
jgi:hypothetical protein